MSGSGHGVVVRREGAIVSVVIDRPETANMLSRDAVAALQGLADRLRDDDAAHVLTLTGAGAEHFCTGVLNPELRARLSKEEVLETVFAAGRLFDALEALPQIVIAGVNGLARAGGAELLLACDIRIAAAHAGFVLPEARWGGFPGAGAPVRLPAIVGRGRALELICTGREIGAAEMLRYGLVEEVVPAEGLAAAVAEMTGRVAASGPLAVRGAKRIMAVRGEPGFAAGRALSDALRRALERSQDIDEGAVAHRENRPPRFVGR